MQYTSLKFLYNFYHLPKQLWEGNVLIVYQPYCTSPSPVQGSTPLCTGSYPPYRPWPKSLCTESQLCNPMYRVPDWPRLETCLNLFTWGSHYLAPTPLVLTSGDCILRHIQWASRRYLSYWNAFFLQIYFQPVLEFYLLGFSHQRQSIVPLKTQHPKIHLETSSISVECKPPACREYGLHKIWRDVDILPWPWCDLHFDVRPWPY